MSLKSIWSMRTWEAGDCSITPPLPRLRLLSHYALPTVSPLPQTNNFRHALNTCSTVVKEYYSLEISFLGIFRLWQGC